VKFHPKTEAEIASTGLWPPGEYDFEVKDAAEETSSAGNEMIKLQLSVYNQAGERITVFDYLVHTQKSAYKVRHFAEATGMLLQYERGDMDAIDCVHKAGRCKIAIKKDNTGQYPDKNSVADYVKAAARVASPPPARARQPAPAGDIDDEIPF
jgi:hypothetical protein